MLGRIDHGVIQGSQVGAEPTRVEQALIKAAGLKYASGAGESFLMVGGFNCVCASRSVSP